MSKFLTRSVFAGLALTAMAGAAIAQNAAVSTQALPPKSVAWSFDGPFGTYDRASLQRGFQVYKEVCSACHRLSYVQFHTLSEPGGPGFTDAEMKAIASSYMLPAGPNDKGQTTDANGNPLTRPGTPADHFPRPFPNDAAARASFGGALPPDLSLIIKARPGHANYVYSLLTGFGQKPPAGLKIPPGKYYNPYFEGRVISMPPPLSANQVTYADGTNATVAQEAHDVATFLTWASYPKMEQRKQMGMGVMIFLFAFGGLLYGSYRKIWHGQH